MAATILIADDEAYLRRLVTATLEGEPYALLEAGDGLTALDLARRVRPRVALLDVQMPGLDGLAVCRAIKQDPALAGTTVVMLTHRGDVADRQRGREAGADEYLPKPFSPLRLLTLLEGVVESGY